MPTPNLSFGIENVSADTIEEIADQIAIQTKELEWLLQNLDTKNIKELSADVITAGVLNAGLVTVRSELEDGAFIELNHTGMMAYDGEKKTFHIDSKGRSFLTGTLNIYNEMDNGSYLSLNSEGILAYNGLKNKITFHIDSNGNTFFTGTLSVDFDNGGYFTVDEYGLSLVDRMGDEVFGFNQNGYLYMKGGLYVDFWTGGSFTVDDYGVYALTQDGDLTFMIDHNGKALFSGMLTVDFIDGGYFQVDETGVYAHDGVSEIFTITKDGAFFHGYIDISSIIEIPIIDEDGNLVTDIWGNPLFEEIERYIHINPNEGMAFNNGEKTFFHVSPSGRILLDGQLEIYGANGRTVINEYGIDPDFVKRYKNVVHNSSFEVLAVDNRPMFWSGGIATKDASWDDSYSLYLTQGETAEQQNEENETIYMVDSSLWDYPVRVSFYSKSGTCTVEVNGQSYVATSVDWTRHSFVAPNTGPIKPKITCNSSEVWIDSIQCEPDFNGLWPSFYTDGPNSISSSVSGGDYVLEFGQTEMNGTEASLFFKDNYNVVESIVVGTIGDMNNGVTFASEIIKNEENKCIGINIKASSNITTIVTLQAVCTNKVGNE